MLNIIRKKSLSTEIHTISCNGKGYADNEFQLLAETIVALKNHVGDKRKYNQALNNIKHNQNFQRFAANV